MAAAIAFNVLVAFIPLILAVLGMAGFLLRQQEGNPADRLLDIVLRAIPPVSAQFQQWIAGLLHALIEQSTGLLSIGMLGLIWFATRLIGTLRSTLKQVFDLAEDRGIIAGKIFDVKMVFAAGALFTLSVGITVAMDIVAGLGLRVLGVQLSQPGPHRIYVEAVAFVSIWVMFVLIFRYLPARRAQWRTSLVAASFTAVLFELLKLGFSWYVTSLADYTSMFGNLATLVILVLWIYYSAVVFILGGEVAQIFAMKRIRKRQKERLS